MKRKQLRNTQANTNFVKCLLYIFNNRGGTSSSQELDTPLNVGKMREASGYNYYMTTSYLRVDDNQVEHTFHCFVVMRKIKSNDKHK